MPRSTADRLVDRLADTLASRARALVVASSLLALSPGCTLYAGQPWGVAETNLDVTFALDGARLDDFGRWKTARDYVIDLERFSLVLDEVRVQMREGDEGAASFDPGNPPPGYSLCHNDHCHHESGRLVSYDEIDRELSGGGASGPAHVRRVENDEIFPGETPWEVALSPCEADCTLPRGTLARLEVNVAEVRLHGRVLDLRTGEAARLPEGGVEIVGRVPMDVLVGAPLEGAVGKGEPLGVKLDARLDVSDALFDALDFAAVLGDATEEPRDLSDLPTIATALAEGVTTSTLDVKIERFDASEPELVLWPGSPHPEEHE